MKKVLLSILTLLVAFTSCDDTTGTIGGSLTDLSDKLDITTAVYGVSTESVVADSVLARSSSGYLGKVLDPETDSYVTCNYMSQLHSFSDKVFPPKDSICSIADGEIIADSCIMIVSFKSWYGDSLAAMRCTIHELERPMEEDQKYYSSFSPLANGYIRKAAGSIHKSKNYAVINMELEENDRSNSSYIPYFTISLNDPYTDRNGKTYNNYGSYLLQKYYTNRASFDNSYDFTHDICPGFYYETTGGVGSMLNVYVTQLNVYYRYSVNGKAVTGISNFSGTEEVLQKTSITQDKSKIQSIADEGDHTYLKTPAGIYTRVTLPIDSVLRDYSVKNGYVLRKDSINTARMTIKRLNSQNNGNYTFAAPQTLLVVPDTMKNEFFTNRMVADYRKTFLVSYSSTENGYVFGNISSLISNLAKDKLNYINAHPGMTSDEYDSKFPNWNKVVLVPVKTSYNSTSTSQVLSKVTNDMSLGSTRLEGGKDNPGSIKLNVIYTKFQGK